MAGYRSNGRSRQQVPGAQPTGQSTLGPRYTALVWSCDRCGAAVTDTDAHTRHHLGLVELWERGR